MCWSKTLLILFSILAVCHCDTAAIAREKYHHHHHKNVLFHEFHYLIFLAFKFKIILVLGSIWAIGLIIGKIFAIFKFAEYMKKNYYHDDHHEKIIYMSPHHGASSYDYPGIYGKSYSSASFPPVSTFDRPAETHYGGDSFSSSYSVDQLPPDAHISGAGSDDLGSPPSTNGYGRSSKDEPVGFYENFAVLAKIIRKSNLTEMAFKDMNLKTDDCKRKFVCEADFNARQSSILKTVYDMLSDDCYQKYKTNQTITTIGECSILNPNCPDDTA